MDLEEYRRASLEQWEQSAPNWGELSSEMHRSTAPVSHWVVEAVNPQPGQTILELAAGPGETGFMAVELLRPGGHLISSDFSEQMVDEARKRALELGIEDAEFRVLNAESLKLDTASVDGVLCRWGYMLMADPAAALRETRRVLRPLGRVALAVWSTPDVNPWVARMGALVREATGAPAPDPTAPGMFALADASRLEDMLAGAGFQDVRIDPIDFDMNYDSPRGWWDVSMQLARPLRQLVDSLPEAETDALRAAAVEAAEEFRRPDGTVSMPARALGATATA
jgi:SAM-dependent methyltransferase